MQQKRDIAYPQDDISFLDVVSFFLGYWKLVLATFAAGIALAFGYLNIAQKQFEAQALIKVGQVLVSSIGSQLYGSNKPHDNNKDDEKLFSVNFESPAVIAEQFRLPTAFSDTTVKSCGVASPEALLPKVRLQPSKSTTSVIELAVRSGSPEAAKLCANAVFEQIRQQQQRQLQPYKADLERIRLDVEANYRENQDLADKMERAGMLQSLYLARRDTALALRQQLNQIRRTQEFDNLPQLLAPVYAPQQQAFPVRSKTIVFGAMAGLLLGLAISALHFSFGKWRQRKQAS